ncbi:hypothetical protein K1T73_16385 [Roseovarius sp. SCSIO 43702]|uniref:hypothetical protein n=1 Tax=Roseovarius sp. SCSIO 43702 TaxID=2823043 RepID=UPI001C73D727|nr:hypothetical protein [Roseovarius sp. SCSIO 43702]QYX56595.1 hypothetical protein K1T73_16385 [Roseovarius sp. SCSIO 43702]
MSRPPFLAAFAALSLALAPPAGAGAPEVVDAEPEKTGMGWRVHVTIAHPDTGWDHYADGWEVLDAEGNRLGFRELLHPHVDEQPFTRSLGNVMPPDGAEAVFVRPRCSRDGWSDAVFRVPLPR